MIIPVFPKKIVKMVLEDGTELESGYMIERAQESAQVSDMGTTFFVIAEIRLPIQDYCKFWEGRIP